MTPLSGAEYYRASFPWPGADSLTVTWTDSDIRHLQRKLADRVVGRQVLYYDTVRSTMDEAGALAEDGWGEGAVVIAEEQTAARGRFERRWVSAVGQDVTFSLVLRPRRDQLSQVNMAATLAVADMAQQLTGLASSIKWPNDVMMSGRKLAGILIETAMDAEELRHAVVGIGINVNLDPSEYAEISSIATSLYSEMGSRVGRASVIVTVLERLDDLYAAVRRGRSLTEAWAARLDTLGRTVKVRWRDREVEGVATGVDESGNLRLTGPDGSTTTVVAGEVTLQA